MNTKRDVLLNTYIFQKSNLFTNHSFVETWCNALKYLISLLKYLVVYLDGYTLSQFFDLIIKYKKLVTEKYCRSKLQNEAYLVRDIRDRVIE